MATLVHCVCTRDYIPHEVKEALVRLGGMLPMNIFLRQEIDRMQKILTLVRRTLSDLKGQSHECLFFYFSTVDIITYLCRLILGPEFLLPLYEESR
jgi:hypothetical protein